MNTFAIVKIKGTAKILSVVLLLGIFLYATAVRELHYAFSVKYHTTAHDHKCVNHIHSTDKEDDCAICKIDVNHIYNHTPAFVATTHILLVRIPDLLTSEGLFSQEYPARHLRGPPALA